MGEIYYKNLDTQFGRLPTFPLRVSSAVRRLTTLSPNEIFIKYLVPAIAYFPLASIIGSTAFNDSVRNGKRLFHRLESPEPETQY